MNIIKYTNDQKLLTRVLTQSIENTHLENATVELDYTDLWSRHPHDDAVVIGLALTAPTSKLVGVLADIL